MPKASPLQSNFNGGEISELLHGRIDTERYKICLAKCLNYLPMIQGGLTKRPGTVFAAEVKDSTKATRLQKFEFSTTQAYAIEFGDLYARFYMNGGQILEAAQAITVGGITQASPAVVNLTAHGYTTGEEVYVDGVVGMTQVNGRNFKVGTTTANTFQLLNMDGSNLDSTAYTAYSSGGTVARVYTITTPYAEAHLFQMNFVQSQDVLYITHPSYAPRKLTRTAHTSWTLTTIDFLDGPYLPANTTSTTLTPGAVSGSTTLTASATTGINGGAGFQTTDVGRLVRIFNGAWSWAQITAWTSTTQVTITIRGPNMVASGVSTWRLGIWSGTTGYPSCTVFHEDRLCFAGATAAPQRVDLSVTSDYENFAPTDSTGAVLATSAFPISLNANDVNSVQWLVSSEKGMLAGTSGGEWFVRRAVESAGLSFENVDFKQMTPNGSANIQPIVIGKVVLYVQRSTKKVRELSYNYEEDGFRSPDRTLLATHMSGSSGFKQTALMKSPQSIAWFLRNDGVLTGMTYEKDEEGLILGWHRHILGGVSDAANSQAIVESICSLPSSDGRRDDTWLIVRRRINGRSVRTVEYISAIFDEFTEQRDAFFVDCGLTYDNPLTISGATLANPCVLTVTGHGLSNGDAFIVHDVKGLMESSDEDAESMVNGETFIARNVTANTLELEDVRGNAVDSSAWTAYVSGGTIRKFVTTVSGLWHLEGQSVAVFGDGAPQPNKTVTNGTITLATRAATVAVGLQYNADGQMLRLEAGALDGTSLGKNRRMHKAAFFFFRTLGVKIGMSFSSLTELPFRTTADPLTRAPGLYSGIRVETLSANSDKDNMLCWRSSQPLPFTLLAVAPSMHTEDAA